MTATIVGQPADQIPPPPVGQTVFVGQDNTGAVLAFISKQRTVAERAKQADAADALSEVEGALLEALRADKRWAGMVKSGDFGSMPILDNEYAEKDYVYNPSFLGD